MQLSGGGHDRAPHAESTSAGNSRFVPGYRLSLRRDLPISRSHEGGVGAQSDQRASKKYCGTTGILAWNSPSHGSHTVLPVAQSGTPDGGSRPLRALVYRLAQRAVANAKKSQKSGAASFAGRQDPPEGESSGRLDVGASVGIHRGEGPQLSSPVRRRIRQHRLPTVHGHSRGPEQSQIRPLERQKTGMRNPHFLGARGMIHLLLGFFIALAVGLTGVGGGSFTVPALLRIVECDFCSTDAEPKIRAAKRALAAVARLSDRS